MGLDVYLYKITDFEKMTELQEEYDKRSNEIWEGVEYDKLSNDEKTALSKKTKDIKEKLGLNSYGEPVKYQTSIEKPSKKYPQHMFKIGYFRSSYNGSGFNSVLQSFTGKDLYTIFDIDREEYYQKPFWEKSLVKAQLLLEEFQNHELVKSNMAILRTLSFFPSEITETQQAFQIFKEEKDKNKSFGEYSNKNGDFFFGKPLRVEGILHGISFDNVPTTYIIHKLDGDYDWYTQALEIVIETINYVLSKKDKDKYYLGWSA